MFGPKTKKNVFFSNFGLESHPRFIIRKTNNVHKKPKKEKENK